MAGPRCGHKGFKSTAAHLSHTHVPLCTCPPPLLSTRLLAPHAAVIFLKATYAELTKAGYENLDPHHKLFLLHRPDTGDEEQATPDISVLSPRPLLRSSRSSPRRWSPRRVEVGVEAVQVRQGFSLTSKRKGVLRKGAKLKVLNTRVWGEDGTERLCVGSADPGEPTFTPLPIGWISAKPNCVSSVEERPGSQNTLQHMLQPKPLPTPQSRWADSPMEC